MSKFKDPNPEWPIPVRKIIDGKLDTVYCHSQKELDKYTATKEDGGLEYVTTALGTEFPKTMSHPTLPDAVVKDAAEEKKYAKRGYNFDHWENKQAKDGQPEAGAAPSFDPKAAAKTAEMEASLKKAQADNDALREDMKRLTALVEQALTEPAHK